MLVPSVCFKEQNRRKMQLLKKAGCDLLILGLQKTDPLILKEIGRDPQEPEIVKDIVSTARKYGIATVVEFIFGLPGESEKSMKKDMAYSIKIRPDYSYFHQLLLIDGSKLYDEYFLKNRKVCNLSEKRIKRFILKAMLNFYLNPIIILQNFSKLIKKPKFILVGTYYLFNLVKNKSKMLFA